MADARGLLVQLGSRACVANHEASIGTYGFDDGHEVARDAETNQGSCQSGRGYIIKGLCPIQGLGASRQSTQHPLPISPNVRMTPRRGDAERPPHRYPASHCGPRHCHIRRLLPRGVRAARPSIGNIAGGMHRTQCAPCPGLWCELQPPQWPGDRPRDPRRQCSAACNGRHPPAPSPGPTRARPS